MVFVSEIFGYVSELDAESCGHQLAGCTFIVTILFFLWEFGYGLLDTLSSHFQDVLNITAGRSSGLQASYFAAYFLCPLTISGWICRKYGFRVTFMTSLSILAVGCLLCWPSGTEKSFGGFCGSMFVVGAGLPTLETAADPFLSICGPPRYSEIRLNLGQAVQGVGTFIGPLLASRVFFANTVDTEAGLKNVQWTYLAIACFVALLIILFWLAPFPEITDADQAALESLIADSHADPGPFRKQYTLFLEAGRSSAKSSDLLSVAQGLYAFMRFVSGGLIMLKPFKPRIMLLVFLLLCPLLSILAIVTKGTTSIVMITLVLCFESHPLSDSLALLRNDLLTIPPWSWSPYQAWWLTTGCCNLWGMVFPPMMGAVVRPYIYDYSYDGLQTIPMMGYILALSSPIYVNLYKRDVMDLHRDTGVNVTDAVSKDIALEEGPHSEPATANVETVREDKAAEISQW
ncbi:hypothetical protein N7493_004676 [Penicillium malachiteum]|uniref:Major facilitator superfamily (MFS) profile domain-containing protein n=1 Tax=Penicillium malachiteum TaxID=1324776 RepID=A0AAD6HP34_9EURO|nr:hypothetical protein N7493_004676 [Penicillium malachiteum]